MTRFLQHGCLVLLALLVACTSGDDTAQNAAKDAKAFRFSLNSAPSSLDPVRASTLYANSMVLAIYDTLYAYKILQHPYEIKPSLAAGMPEISQDGLTYTIRLREGVRFADSPVFEGGKGRELTAEDFVYSLKRHFDPATRPGGAWLWQGRIEGMDDWKKNGSDYAQEVSGLRALNRYTVQIRLTQPYPQLVYTLAMGYSALVPREAIDYFGREFSVNPVGSGPFRLVSFDSASAVLVPNENFYQAPLDLAYEGYDPVVHSEFNLEVLDGRKPPFVDRLDIAFIKEGSARWSSFTKDDEVQYTGLPSEQVDRVLSSTDPVTLRPEYAEKYRMRSALEAGFVFSTFNMDFPEIGYNEDPERDRRNHALRCAMISGFDWQARNESWYTDLGVIFPGIIPPATPEFDPDMSQLSVTYDVERARTLLKDNNWNADNLPILEYGTMPGPTSRLFYEQFRAWMKRIGYPPEKIVLKTYATFGDIAKAWRNSELPIISKGWGLDYPDAENTLQLFYGPNGSPGSNDGNYANPKFDEMYRQASVMLPSPERTALYRKMNKLVVDDCAAITGLSRQGIVLWHKNVVILPDRNFISGRFLKYVDILPAEM
ncbi:MAG: ABC transporter substrate-binding protein [Gammaproteobacteria bacterium]